MLYYWLGNRRTAYPRNLTNNREVGRRRDQSAIDIPRLMVLSILLHTLMSLSSLTASSFSMAHLPCTTFTQSWSWSASHAQGPYASAAGWSGPSGPWLLWWQRRWQASQLQFFLKVLNKLIRGQHHLLLLCRAHQGLQLQLIHLGQDHFHLTLMQARIVQNCLALFEHFLLNSAMAFTWNLSNFSWTSSR